ncbi:sensor histidine kinase [Kordia sp.]|uniref:sensor histidine kinase n=1 Tax=Kordia sp. TaxID=1965332 RepID=UPI003D6B51A1
MKYIEAKEHLTKEGNDTTYRILNLLTDILYDAGQDKDESYYPDVIETQTDFDRSVFLLLKGYQHLYYHSTEIDAYNYFNQGYVLAKKNGYIALQKQFLLGLLELYHAEILQSNEQYSMYLDDFKELISDDVDRFLHLLYTSILRTKTINDIDKLSSSDLREISEFVSRTKTLNKNLLIRYDYEKAIYHGFDENYEAAKAYYAKVLTNVEYPFMKYMIFGSHLQLAKINTKLGNYEYAFKAVKAADAYIDKRDSLRSLFYICYYKANLYAKTKKYDSAYILQNKRIELGNQLQHRKNSLDISRMNILYETEKQKRLLLEEEKTSKKRGILLLGAIVLILFISIITILILKNQTKKQKLLELDRKMQKQKIEHLLKQQELLSIDAMIAGQEKERRRVAIELHDDLGSLMTTIKFYCESMLTNKKVSMNKVNELLDEAYTKIRKLAHTKNSGVLASQGLVPAIKKMALAMSQSDTIKFDVHIFGMENRMENSTELNVFRIIQELSANIMKHASASYVNIQLTQYEDILNIMVEDNGIGFEAAKMNEYEGIGLKSIEKKVEYMGGTFTIDSMLTKGTSIIIDIPL